MTTVPTPDPAAPAALDAGALDAPAAAGPEERAGALAVLTALGERRAALVEELDRVTGDLRAGTVAAVAAGTVSEAAAARAARVDRMTVREWRGVRRRTREG